jgi:plastocyanin domain-containing protein
MKRHCHVVLTALGLAAGLGILAWGCSRAPAGAGAASGPQTVAIEVTDRGFVPARVQVRAGSPVTLLVTRRTDATCAKEIVLADEGIRRDLPLNEAVRIEFTPKAAGEHRYACGMGMVSGTMKVQ